MPSAASPTDDTERGFRCAVCDGSRTESLFGFADYPAYLVPLPPAIAASVRRGRLAVWRCVDCGHLQQPAPDRDLQRAIYSEDYAHYAVDSAEPPVPFYPPPLGAFVTAHA